jgi:hypothetical protein
MYRDNPRTRCEKQSPTGRNREGPGRFASIPQEHCPKFARSTQARRHIGVKKQLMHIKQNPWGTSCHRRLAEQEQSRYHDRIGKAQGTPTAGCALTLFNWICGVPVGKNIAALNRPIPSWGLVEEKR